ncbi:GNAT family N-acetyltransferase [Phenylobacterium sp.]|uniref:GNAT family N-acetyltransferase n=1 Tax=Phenylobacterium sp. TaxID=1871053 RepID=UPI0027353696|nr:GNAT family N-acetyltransferase [Phenylobacterium sp.]MDP3853068.1 GNAT family N-acetyltransferase [Phenylobacterium sp.]
MAAIRRFRAGDLQALYDICLKTGDSGQDATRLYADPRILGEIYAAPYGVLQPDLAFVAEDDQGVAAYVLGTPDTRAFEARQEAEWWPRLRTLHPEPPGPPNRAWTRDQWRAYQMHHPFSVPQAVVEAAPAHLHINLLPRLQGQGMGQALVATLTEALREAGARQVHLGCDAANHRALRFYDVYGFSRFDEGRDTVWMMLDLG